MAIGTLPEKFEDDGDSDAIFAEINITPLTDVFLVLLIIFMVSSSAITQSGVKVNLPKAGAASAGQNERGVTVTIAADGGIFIDKDQVSLENLEGVLRTRLEGMENKSVILAGDQDVLLGMAISVMNTAKKAGAEKFGIATKGRETNTSGASPK